jgi:hypothetical protein
MEKLSVKSLQIGDYVNYRGQIIKVTSLYDKGGSNEVGWGIKEDTWVNADNIEPIPLTSEILEKNGFIEVKHYYPYPTYEYVVDSQKFLIRVAFPKDSKATERTKPIVEVDAEWCWHSGDCEFFHELQHVLRDCKIKKEIVL